VIELDTRVFRALHQVMSGSLVLAVMAILTVIGSGWSLLALAPLLASPKTRRFAAALLAVLATTSFVVVAIKLVVRRMRPFASLPGIEARVFPAPTDFSFPSGHAAGSFACATFAACLLLRDRARDRRRQGDVPSSAVQSLRSWRVLVAFLLYMLAAGIALSRVALGVHFPGDIAVGAVLGTALGGAGAWLYLRQDRFRFDAISALATPVRSSKPKQAVPVRSSPPP